MKTEANLLRAKVYVFAKAKTQYEIENLKPGELPFEYRVKDYDYGDETSVRIMEHEIIVPIPEGIDITRECVKNLREKIVAVEEKAKKDIQDLNDRITKLALIEYRPDTDAADNVLVDEDDYSF